MSSISTSVDKLGTEKISKLLVSYAIPSIIAMSASALYNIASSIFIGHGVSPLALVALGIILPLSNLSAAFGAMVGIGASSLLSIKLGQQDHDSAKSILGNVVLLNAITGLAFGVLCFIFLDPILYLLGASENTIDYAREFMQILLIANVVTHIYFGLNHTMRASGYPRKSMYIMVASVIINIILSAMFILWFKWGVAGAAWATVIAQCIALALQLAHFMNKKHDIRFSRDRFRLDKKIVKGIMSIGAAPFFMNVGSTAVVILINITLRNYGGDTYIGAFSIINRVSLIFLMILIGLNQGMQPIVGYNYGSRQLGRVKETLKIVLTAAIIVATLGFILGVFFPRAAASAFTSDKDLLDASTRALRIAMCVFPIIAFQIVSSSFFQSIGMPKKAIFLSLTRQLLFLIPLLLILPRYLGTDGVWWSMPISDFISSLLAMFLLSRQMREFNKQEGLLKQ